MRRDPYRSFTELAGRERDGIDYQVRWHERRSSIVVAAIHGGKIEPGTSEIAEAIAGEHFSFYAFEGIKRGHNIDLRLPVEQFDEPDFVAHVAPVRVRVIVTGSIDLKAEYVNVTGGGGLKARVMEAIRDTEIEVCDAGDSPALQLELSSALRERLKDGTTDLDDFASAVRHTLLRFDQTVAV